MSLYAFLNKFLVHRVAKPKISRLTTLLHYSKLGVHLTREKQEALLKGGASNSVVHPFFVYQACSYGMFYAENFIRTPGALHIQAKYAQLAWEELAKIQKGSDDRLKAQAMLSICSCCIVFRWVDFARQYIQKACRIVDSTSLRFIPRYGQPPEYSEEVRERSTVLSQVIYFENYLFLTCGGSEPTLTARIEREFRHELQVGGWSTCMLTHQLTNPT
ncbi:hypothetical protein BDM02DRAFT_1798648 [Thelephora ganbajun]|uniref:Uncharacterized protein n=1 Tax=Thelephora ganbajun TaxID=370292 RepID=A0ACB6Z074_THEGA|nr:hypothetical protein BDM02DRAFT_1798648 [Thelephora ganbajun]